MVEAVSLSSRKLAGGQKKKQILFCRRENSFVTGTLEIKGGICLSLFGMSERYALNELVYQGIMSSGNVNDIVSGDELVSMVMQSANYLAKDKEKAVKVKE